MMLTPAKQTADQPEHLGQAVGRLRLAPFGCRRYSDRSRKYFCGDVPIGTGNCHTPPALAGFVVTALQFTRFVEDSNTHG